MPKNIVICCDGTGNEFGPSNSNVVKLYWSLASAPDQACYYHPGVGTMGARNALTDIGKLWTKIRGLAFGYGVSDNIADAYSFLMQVFEPGDQVFIFGFSRGAYTARALCGLLKLCGLLTPGNEAQIPYALRLFKSTGKDKFDLGRNFRATFSIECKPYFLGVWDTVSSVGWILDPIGLKPWSLPYTSSLPDLSIVRHAVSIDERRAFFRQNLVHEPLGEHQDLKQVWFAGVHSDVGGSYAEAESGLAKITLRWMLCEAAAAGLKLDPDRVKAMLGSAQPYVPPDPAAVQHESLNGFWWFGEFWPKRHMSAVTSSGGENEPGKKDYKAGIRFNLGRHRQIPEGAHIHKTVFDRRALTLPAQKKYAPKNLPATWVVEQETSCELVPQPVVTVGATTVSKPPLHKHPAVATALIALAVLIVCGVAIGLFTLTNSLATPQVTRPAQTIWLDQHWTKDQRQRYYHTPQGSNLLPYSWFLALEQPRLSLSLKGAPAFRDNAYLSGFGFIPDDAYALNPDGLPVGFARDEKFVDPYSNQPQVVLGFTCAACHTGELFYRDKAIRIDAGPAMTDLQKFSEALGLAVTWTYFDPLRFHRFANRVLGPNHSSADRKRLRADLKYYLDTAFAEVKATHKLYPTGEGYGRTDALARIGNFVFGTELANNKNLVVGDGPVNFPPVWDASWLDWVQYNGSIQQPMGRNVGEALGVRSRINLRGYPGAQFANTIRVDGLQQIENLLGGARPGDGVWSPKWPESVFGNLDRTKAAQGELLYRRLCISCHKPPMNSPDGQNPQYWTTRTDPNGSQFFKVTMVPLEFIGTDPKQAENFYNRKADTGPLNQGVLSAGDGLTYITQKVIEQAYTRFNLTPEQIELWNGHRKNIVRAPLAYKARPHNGIWATPPYLHNGSVPNLYELLSPVSERSTSFYLGRKDFDPVKLGLNTEGFEGATRFDVTLPGNSNAGHEFNDGPKGKGILGRKLTPDERMAIIEYFKTL
ncbi:MAG: di-heme-cytochrome C peroxidase [Candidatus Sulfotelmatobacter sp.]